MLNGYGIAYLSNTVAVGAIRTGQLVRLLPDWTLPERDIYVVYPSEHHLSQSSGISGFCERKDHPPPTPANLKIETMLENLTGSATSEIIRI